jgi:U32 family peptidase
MTILKTTKKRKPELLAPAGTAECAVAAIENGADAIYFGLDVGFNARARAHNISFHELPALMARMHLRGVRGYVTLNTLVFTDELSRLEEHVRRVTDAGVDAVLVQDLGATRLIREVSPELEIHASTQMTLTCASAMEGVRELGIDRVVLARELSLKEIAHITERTDIPVEVFVHGALCVAYSGQCLTSESLGGRSANRGQCAQACRLPYELYCDHQPQDLGDIKYLLSPQDLAAYDLVPQLTQLGVASLKIEGRLKTPEYVANVTQHYRQAIDAAWEGRSVCLESHERRDLEMSFSRGFSPGWLEGCDHKRLVPGLNSAKRGVLVGKVVRSTRDRLTVNLSHPLMAGDGIVLQGDRAHGDEIGGRVFAVYRGSVRQEEPVTGCVDLTFADGVLVPARIFAGQEVWQTDDPRLNRRLRQTYSHRNPAHRLPIRVNVLAEVGKSLRLKAMCEDGIEVVVSSDQPLEKARRHPMTIEEIRKQVGRLGETAYVLGDLDATIIGEPMVPLSVLGKLRHDFVAALDLARTAIRSRPTEPDGVVLRMLPLSTIDPPAPAEALKPVNAPKSLYSSDIDGGGTVNGNAVLHVLCRTLQQVQGALAAGTRSVIADFHDLRQYRLAVDACRQVDAMIALASLRIHKPGEDGLFIALAKHEPDMILVRNLPALYFAKARGIPFVADFSLNVTNPLSADYLMGLGAQRVTASYDMNRDQLLELTAAIPPEWLEIVIHQHMPLFHMEHCVFCAVLSPGKNKSDCGRPCDRHEVALKDHVGAVHPLHADIGCRNTLFNSSAQSGAEAVAPLRQRSIRHFRVELLSQNSADEIATLIGLYQQLLAGRIDGSSVWRELKAMNRVGVTRGTLEQPRDPLAIL